jgi:hypothetical protein
MASCFLYNISYTLGLPCLAAQSISDGGVTTTEGGWIRVSSVIFHVRRKERSGKADSRATVRTKKLDAAKYIAHVVGSSLTKSIQRWPAAANFPRNFWEFYDPKKLWYQRTISLFPSTSGTEAETNPRGPSSALEQEHGENNTERQTEGGLDNDGGDGAVPLNIKSWVS